MTNLDRKRQIKDLSKFVKICAKCDKQPIIEEVINVMIKLR